jgi:ribosomal-protein-alanine N-acetyltransferase
LPCSVRLMRKEDIAQVTEIDREAFPTLWTPINYQRELQNQLAHYIVAYNEETVGEPEVKAATEKHRPGLLFKMRQLLNHNRLFDAEMPPSGKQNIVGFAGFWIMADEAHIINIAVRELYRRKGIGELLLISIIDLAIELNAKLITLEVRASNTAAQSLYYKYGFTEIGSRRGYYTDNREDATLMSVENTASTSFQTHLKHLRQSHARRWGVALYDIAHS